MKTIALRGSIFAAVAAILAFGFSTAPRLHAQQPPIVDPAIAAKGEWSASTKYAADDLVTARGSSWRAKVANKNKVPGQTHPSTSAFWELFARGFNPTGAWSNAT